MVAGRVRLPYIVRSYIDLTRIPGWYEGGLLELSPYDLESVVVVNALAQPRITPISIEPGTMVRQGPCKDAVMVGTEILCNAVGFSHPRHGVAIVKGFGKVKLKTVKEERSYSYAIYNKVPGAFVGALYSRGRTDIVLASFAGIKFYEGVSHRKPLECSLGYRVASCTFDDGKTVVASEEGYSVVGFPLRAMARLPSLTIGVSGGWLIMLEASGPKPLAAVSDLKFVGLVEGAPLLWGPFGALYRIEGGALVEYMRCAPGTVTAYDSVVVDGGALLEAYNLRRERVLAVDKEPSTRCWATKYGTLCCVSTWCGIILPGESVVEIEEIGGGRHALRIRSSAPLVAKYGGKEILCVPEAPCTIVDERASVLRDHTFTLILKHMLGSLVTSFTSHARKPRVEVLDARAYASSALHRCGGLYYAVLQIGGLEPPEGVRFFIEGEEVKPEGTLTLCTSRGELEIKAVDVVSGDSVVIGKVKPQVIYIPAPAVKVDLVHEEHRSRVILEADGVVDGRVCCSGACKELGSELRDCELPGYIEVTVDSEGFLFHFRRSIDLPPLMNCSRRGEEIICRQGGLILRLPVPKLAALPPLSDAFISVEGGALQITFKSAVEGRGLLVTSNYAASLAIKPGLNKVLAPLDLRGRYILAVSTGTAWWFYRIAVPLKTFIELAARSAAALYEKVVRTLLSSSEEVHI